MKGAILACAIAAGAAFMPNVHANEKLAQAAGCMTCHGVDKKVIGPGFKEVAAKYRGDATAEAGLFKKVKAGSKGVWGDVPMPPNAHVKDDDVKTLVKWVLSLK